MEIAVAAPSPTVLIVDDDTDLREGLGELLEEDGYGVATATDGMDALHKLRQGLRPSVILLDLMMPRMNGWEFRQAQLSSDELKDIPVVVITAAGLGEAAIRTQFGDVGFLPKPTSEQALRDAIRRRCPAAGGEQSGS
jgi:two-component system response regulator MprA